MGSGLPRSTHCLPWAGPLQLRPTCGISRMGMELGMERSWPGFGLGQREEGSLAGQRVWKKPQAGCPEKNHPFYQTGTEHSPCT